MAVADTVLNAAAIGGIEPHHLDLYRDGFDPAHPDHDTVDEHRRLLAETTILILCYPTWWSSQPAMLQGWFDSVWSRETTRPTAFPSITQIIVCTTHGSPKWLNALEGESGKRTISRYLRSRASRTCRVRWLALYRMDTVDEDGRRAHLDRIAKRIRRLSAR